MTTLTTLPTGRARRVAAAIALTAGVALGTSACGAAPADDGAAAAADDGPQTTFRIGTGADNPLEAGVVEYLASVIAPDHGITVEVVELEDSRHLSEAVNAGELDGHVAIHEPYLKSVIAEQPDWDLAASVPVYTSLLTLSSFKHTSDDIPDGATVSVSEDPSNQARSLAFLEDQGYITLSDDVDLTTATVHDVAENPRNIRFVTLDGGALARSLEDVDYSVVQASYLRAAGIDDSAQVITVPQDVRLAIVLTTRTENASGERFRLLREAFEDPRLDDYVDDEFGDIAAGVR